MLGSRRNLVVYGGSRVIAAVAIVFGLNDVYGFLNSSSSPAGSQRTATVARGTVQASVSASGNVGVAIRRRRTSRRAARLTAIDVAVGATSRPDRCSRRSIRRAPRTRCSAPRPISSRQQSTLSTAEERPDRRAAGRQHARASSRPSWRSRPTSSSSRPTGRRSPPPRRSSRPTRISTARRRARRRATPPSSCAAARAPTTPRRAPAAPPPARRERGASARTHFGDELLVELGDAAPVTPSRPPGR